MCVKNKSIYKFRLFLINAASILEFEEFWRYGYISLYWM